METVSFTKMEDGTAEEYAALGKIGTAHKAAHFVDNLLGTLNLMKGPKLGYKVDRYEHSLQGASRLLRDGAEEEMVVAGLLHDIGDILAPENHSALAATVVWPYVSEKTHWIVLHHGIFQGYFFWHHMGGDRDARERYHGHPHFEACAVFCEKYDQNCFDPDYDTLPLETFEPMVRRVFSRPTKGSIDHAV